MRVFKADGRLVQVAVRKNTWVSDNMSWNSLQSNWHIVYSYLISDCDLNKSRWTDKSFGACENHGEIWWEFRRGMMKLLEVYDETVGGVRLRVLEKDNEYRWGVQLRVSREHDWKLDVVQVFEYTKVLLRVSEVYDRGFWSAIKTSLHIFPKLLIVRKTPRKL